MTDVTIDKLANGGEGVGHLPDGRVVFVPRALPGDVVRIAVEVSKKRWARGRVVQLLEPSPHRVEPACPHFDTCGGCAFQHLDYDTEFAAKVAAAEETFRRISGLELPPGQRLPAPASSGYRIRARLRGDGRHLGYVGARSNKAFDLRSCPILAPELQAVLPHLRATLRVVGDVEVETAGGGEVVVVLPDATDRSTLAAVTSHSAIRGARTRNAERTAGDPTIAASESVGVALDARTPAGRFRQSNGQQTPALRQLVRERVGTGDVLVELFAGSGSFTFALADLFADLQAWELDEQAVQIGNELAAHAPQAHVRFGVIDLGHLVPPLPSGATLLLDPPRTGAAAVCGQMVDTSLARIVYVACDVSTLARDALTLTRLGYVPQTLDLVDMFPRTPHIEAVLTLTPR